MSYLVLARKYRPGNFDEIVGQEHVVRTLTNAITMERVHHAFLFTGARGVGKTTAARVLARALNCEKGPTTAPCGECTACVEIAQSASPDVLEIDGASNRGVDSVRELRETVRYLPSRSRTKLYIIDEVHQLTSEAFNALLKTLEEPPPHVKFIFATTEPQKIPVTILSRCQRFDFRRVSVAQLGELLRSILRREGVELGAAALAAVVREAQGSVRDALSLLDQVLSYAGGQPDDEQVMAALGVVDRQVVFDLCDAVLARDAERILRLVADVDARGHDLSDLASLLVEHFRDLMVAKMVESPSQELLERSPGEIQTLQEQAGRLSRPDLHRYFALLVSVAEDVSRSTFPRVSLEMGLLRLLEVEPTHSLADLLVKLDGLVQGGGGAVSARAAAAAPAAARAAESGTAAPRRGAKPRGAARPEAAGQGGTTEPRGAARPEAAGQGGTTEPRGAARPEAAGQGPGTTEPRGAARPEAAAQGCGTTAPRRAAEPAGHGGGAGAAVQRDDAPAPDSVPSEAPPASWGALVERVREMRPALASVLEHGRPLRFGPDGVEIGYARGTFYWESAHEQDNRALLERVLEEHFGKRVALALAATGGEGVSTLAEAADRRRRARESEIRAGALAHPAVQGAISILGGEVKQVTPLAPDTSERS